MLTPSQNGPVIHSLGEMVSHLVVVAWFNLDLALPGSSVMAI